MGGAIINILNGMERKQRSASLICQLIFGISVMTFFGFFAFGRIDYEKSCYGHKVWSPSSDEYVDKVTTYSVKGLLN